MKSQLTLKKALLTILFVLGSVLVFAQGTGKIAGTVTDKATGETLISAAVKVVGTNKVAGTDANGKYAIGGLAAGKYTLEVSYVSFLPKTIKLIEVKENTTTTLNIALEEASSTLNQVVVSGKANKESNTALLAERKNSTLVVQKIGAQELSRKGLSNVAEGVSKIAGVSMVGNKNVFVRGLGDRYNNTTLNGLPIPSTNPDLKLIPLDIFPTSVVKNIGVTKSYSPELYGDFSGGSIDIVTKDYPEQGFFKVGLSSGYNSITTGKDFYTTQRSFLNFAGFDRGERALPPAIDNMRIYRSTERPNLKPNFATQWSPETITAPVATGFSLSGGNSYDLGNSRKFGYLASLGYKNDLRFNDGISAIYNAQQAPDYLYQTERFSYTTNTSALLNLYYKPGSKSSYSVTGMFVNDSSNDIFNQQGFKADLSGDIYARRNAYVQNSLLTGQFSGTNSFSERFNLKYTLGYTNITGSTPDRVQNTFIDNMNATYSFLKLNSSDNHRFFADLNEDDFSGNITAELRSKNVESAFKTLQFGFQGRYKARVFNSRQFETKIGLNPVLKLDQVDLYLNDNNLGSGDDANTFRYDESYYAPNNYEADLTIAASFVNFNFEFNKKLKLIAGVRAEYSEQNTYYKLGSQTYDSPFRVKTIDGLDLLPALTLKYALDDKSNVLFAASKTISRPQFVEAAPFRYNVGFGIAEGEGNPDLVNSDNYNVDLKYEFYPSSGEILAISAFGKYINKPIELSQVNSADPLFTYINTDNAMLAGVELEYNRNIGALFSSSSKALQNMSLGFNGSYIYSKIDISQETINNSAKPIAPTNRSRPLFGASPYLINFDYSYKHNWSTKSNTTFTLAYNVFGKRLFVAGAQQAGDIYEMPVNTLDFIINTKLNNKIGLDFNFGNILNPDIKFQQEYKDNNLPYNQYKRGMNIGVNLNYTF
ncbi:TonB-dependent receptor [Pedobacter sp. SL55]|uniref:TonB-dependent receptor n=1 Tax=Pedobacter sp. SL55 TaxID=2995161 RepID=UPI00226E29CB|nr:TonB-dependent receptor [Pedobacter sp. SL55]WAC40990.1 carboxypeptidase-like regulatory domain-containing protein [Pedobacter sp. SL55]